MPGADARHTISTITLWPVAHVFRNLSGREVKLNPCNEKRIFRRCVCSFAQCSSFSQSGRVFGVSLNHQGAPSFPLQSVRVESTLFTVTYWGTAEDWAAANYLERETKTKRDNSARIQVCPPYLSYVKCTSPRGRKLFLRHLPKRFIKSKTVTSSSGPTNWQ